MATSKPFDSIIEKITTFIDCGLPKFWNKQINKKIYPMLPQSSTSTNSSILPHKFAKH